MSFPVASTPAGAAPAAPAAPGAPPFGRHVSSRATEAPPDALLYLVALNIVTNVWRYHDMYPILGAIKLPSVAIVLVVIAFLMDGDRRRRVALLRSPAVYVIVGLYALMCLGVPTALWQGKAFTFLTKDFGPTLIVTFITALSMRSLRDVEWVGKVFLFAGAFYALNIYLRFPVQEGGRLGTLFFYDANDLALLLACAAPFAIERLRPGTRAIARLAALGATGILVLTIVKSGSRGGFIAFSVVILYMLFRFRAVPAATRVSAIAFGMVVMLAVGSSAYWKQIATIFNPKDDYNWSGNSSTGRMEVWKRAMGYIAMRPVLGVGARNFAQAEGRLSVLNQQRAAENKGVKWSAAHNSFVEIATETGIPGFICFVTVIVLAFRNAARVRKRALFEGDVRAGAIADSIIASLLAYITAGFFLSAEYFPSFYLLVAFSLATERITAQVPAPSAAPGWTPAPPAGVRRTGMRGGLVTGG